MINAHLLNYTPENNSPCGNRPSNKSVSNALQCGPRAFKIRHLSHKRFIEPLNLLRASFPNAQSIFSLRVPASVAFLLHQGWPLRWPVKLSLVMQSIPFSRFRREAARSVAAICKINRWRTTGENRGQSGAKPRYLWDRREKSRLFWNSLTL